MKKTWGSSIIFLIILAVALVLIELNLSRVENSYTLKKDCLENNLNQVDLIVLGSSQAYYDIAPELFSKNGCNLANSNQDFYYDHQILSKYLDRLSGLKYAVISVSYFSLEFDLNNTEEYWRKYFYQRFLDIPPERSNALDLRNYSLIAAYRPETARKVLLPFYRTNLTLNNTASGWFRAPVSRGLPTDNAGSKRVKVHDSYMRSSLITANQQLLEQMIMKLKEKDIKVVLVTLPVSDNYFASINQGKYRRMQKVISEISNEYQIRYLDYFQDTRFKGEDFTDGSDHLDEPSALRFSEILFRDI